MNRQKKTCFVIPSVAPETTAAGCGATRSCLHNHGVIEGRTKRVLIAREQSERNRLHTRAREHNANTEEERQQQIAQRRGKKKEEGKDREKEEGKGKKKKQKKTEEFLCTTAHRCRCWRSFSGNYLRSLSTVLITSIISRRLFASVK